MQARQPNTHSTHIWVLLFLCSALIFSACTGGPVVDPTKDVGGGGVSVSGTKPTAQALNRFKEAVTLQQNDPSQTSKVMSLLKETVSEDPNFGEAWYNLGYLHERQGQFDEAIAAYEKASASRPEMTEATVNLALLLHHKKGETDRAKSLLAAVVDDENGVDPYNVKANLNLGMIYRLEGEVIYQKHKERMAAKTLEENKKAKETKRTQKADGSDEDHQPKMIQTIEIPEEAKKSFKFAIRYVRKALAGDSNVIASYENLAAIYYDQRKYEVALLVCDQAFHRQRERNHFLEEQLKNKQMSQAEFDKKFIKNEEIGPIHNTRGLIFLAQGKVKEAYLDFKKASQNRPKFIAALLNEAGVAINVQDFGSAEKLYRKVLELAPDNLEARLSLAVSLRGLKNYEECEKIYLAVIKDNPEYAPAQFNLAILYQEFVRDLPKAKSIYETFVGMEKVELNYPLAFAKSQIRIKELAVALKNQADNPPPPAEEPPAEEPPAEEPEAAPEEPPA